MAQSNEEVQQLHQVIMQSAGDLSNGIEEVSSATMASEQTLRAELQQVKVALEASDAKIRTEVTEALELNAGRDPFPSFVRRQRCAKPSGATGKFVNPRAELNFKGRKGEDDLENYYTEEDLFIGETVNIFGRKFFLYDADDFTKKYLKDVLGRDSTPIAVREPEKPKPKPTAPPYNGFGDEDDSLGSWKNLVLKAPKKNVRQYIENAGCMLKFSMKLADADPANEVRRFVLTYYLADDTVSIYEPPQRNAGIIGGKFLQRQKARNPAGQPSKAADFFVGATE